MKTVFFFGMLVLGIAPRIVKAQSWSLTGNSGTNPTKNYIGTQDFLPFIFVVNNSSAGIITVTDDPGNVCYGYASYIISSTIPRSQNTAMGDGALFQNTNADSNVAVGYRPLYNVTSDGSWNVGVGVEALSLSKTSFNTAVGYEALDFSNASSNNSNTGIGYESLYANTTGFDNLGFGSRALFSNTGGTADFGFGYQCLYYNKVGISNLGIGQSALVNVSGSYNAAVGSNAMKSITTGGSNTAVGYSANVTAPTAIISTAIGYQATCTSGRQIRFGNSSDTSIGGYANWSVVSDGRYKKNITENVPGLAFIKKLRPVTYNLDVSGINVALNEGTVAETSAEEAASVTAKEQIVHSGFIAQEVEKSANEIGYNFRGVDAPKDENGFYGLRYATFVVPLVKAVQELDASKNNLRGIQSSLVAENSQLKAEGREQDASLDHLEATINNLLK